MVITVSVVWLQRGNRKQPTDCGWSDELLLVLLPSQLNFCGVCYLRVLCPSSVLQVSCCSTPLIHLHFWTRMLALQEATEFIT